MERNKRLIRNTVILEIGTLLSKGMTFIIILLFSSWLSTNEYGTFDILVTYETLLLPFFSLSAGEGLFRFLLSANNELEKKKYSIKLHGNLFCNGCYWNPFISSFIY